MIQMRRIIKVHQQQFYLHDCSMFTNQLAYERVTPGDHYSVACQMALGVTGTQKSGADDIRSRGTW